jgi:hypothetical protein
MTRTIPPDAFAQTVETWIAEIEEARSTLPHSAGLDHVLNGMRQAATVLRSRALDRSSYNEPLTVTGHNLMVQASRSEEV